MVEQTKYFWNGIDVTDDILNKRVPFGFNPRLHADEITVGKVYIYEE